MSDLQRQLDGRFPYTISDLIKSYIEEKKNVLSVQNNSNGTTFEYHGITRFFFPSYYFDIKRLGIINTFLEDMKINISTYIWLSDEDITMKINYEPDKYLLEHQFSNKETNISVCAKINDEQTKEIIMDEIEKIVQWY